MRSKNEWSLIFWNEKRKMNGVEFQLDRIAEHPIQLKGNMIVLDRLEQGVLQIYEPIADNPVYIQPINGTDYVRGAGLVMEMTINIHLEENTVSLKNLRCTGKYAEFQNAMLDQLVHFAEFYDFKIVNEC